MHARSRSPRRSPVAWFAAHPVAAWYAAIAVVAVTLYSVAAPVTAVLYEVPVLAALVVTLVQIGALVTLVRLPRASVGAFAASSLALAAWGAPEWLPWPWPVTTIIAFAVLAGGAWAWHGWRTGLIALLLPAVAMSAPALAMPSGGALASVIVAIGVGAIAAGIGALAHDRFRISRQLTEEKAVSAAEVERRLVAEERQRIARELHDVVAHGLSLIQVQATSAPYRVPTMDPASADEFRDIARGARESLAEMRRLLGVLRGDAPEAEKAPQPTLDDIAELVADTERAGARIRLTMSPPDAPVPIAVGIAAYRIVQEAVSNALRHAPGTAIAVAVGHADGTVLVEIENEPPNTPSAHASAVGHGLVGMRERAAILGGAVEARPTAAGGFRVAATLPIAGAERAGERA